MVSKNKFKCIKCKQKKLIDKNYLLCRECKISIAETLHWSDLHGISTRHRMQEANNIRENKND